MYLARLATCPLAVTSSGAFRSISLPSLSYFPFVLLLSSFLSTFFFSSPSLLIVSPLYTLFPFPSFIHFSYLIYYNSLCILLFGTNTVFLFIKKSPFSFLLFFFPFTSCSFFLETFSSPIFRFVFPILFHPFSFSRNTHLFIFDRYLFSSSVHFPLFLFTPIPPPSFFLFLFPFPYNAFFSPFILPSGPLSLETSSTLFLKLFLHTLHTSLIPSLFFSSKHHFLHTFTFSLFLLLPSSPLSYFPLLSSCPSSSLNLFSRRSRARTQYPRVDVSHYWRC